MINQKHLQEVIAMINEAPYFRLLSIEVTDMGDGFSRLKVSMDKKHLNPFGAIHGGVYSSLIDTAAYRALYCDIGEDEGMVSIDLAVHNLAAVDSGSLVVEARRIKKGWTLCIAEGRILEESGRLLAHGTSKMIITPGMQTIDQAFKWMNVTTGGPKFLESPVEV